MNPDLNPNATTAPEIAIDVHTAALQANMNADMTKVVARVFRSNVPSCRYVFKAGKTVAFLGGKYTTDIAHEIAELDAEIAQRHPNFSANKEEIVDTIEPIEALRKKFFAEFEAAQLLTLRKDNNAGISEQTKLNVANSSTIAAGAASSDSVAGVAPAASAPAAQTITIKK